MNKFKTLIKKYVSPELPMRLCIFNMMSVIGILGAIVSVAATYMININNGQILPMSLAIAILVFLLYIANHKNMLKLASILICCIIGFLVFPLMFISGGGVHSGMILWFILVFVFDSILIEGKSKYFICSLTIIVYTILIYVAYAYPDKLRYFSNDEMVYLDIAQSLIFVGICIVCIISFQLYMYELAIKKAEVAAKEAEKAKEEAEAANNAKSVFLANMSHEIRTPMGVILSMNEMIQRETNQEVVLDYSKDITTAAQSLLSIINDILDFSKIESGKMNIIENEYDFITYINNVVEIANIKSQETGIEFELKLDDNIPKKLFGDDLRIKQCLINLISNAFKYTEKGKVIFEVKGENKGDEEVLSFSVSDTGIGIKDEDREKLFSSFDRLEESRNKAIQGTGLGLNITNKLLNLMDSKLEVESEYGKGSRFYFSIKQRIIDSTPIKSNAESADTDKKVEKVFFEAPGARILVVDDSKINLKVFASLLKKSKMDIDTAVSGFDAIDMVKNTKYDMIFLDHMMPGIDGEMTFLKLKEENLIGDTPVVMLTANALVGMKEHFLELGFANYLSKPIEYNLLEDVLRQHLS